MMYKSTGIHPRRIKNLEEVEAVLVDLDSLAEQGVSPEDCGIALLQNFQLGGFLEIVPRQHYEANTHESGNSEFYCKFWPRAYFEELRERLSRAL